MSLDTDQVEGIAHLARLAIDTQDVPAYADNLSNILGLIEQMNAVDTTGIAPLAHPLEMSQRLRVDAVTEGGGAADSGKNRRDGYQQCAPQTEAGLYLVPQVIE